MGKQTPQFATYTKIEEDALVARLEAIRKAISHPGEKGRALESEVARVVRSFLPGEYGLSSGFVAFHSAKGPQLSQQLDLIIYDALQGGPIAGLGSCDVFPLEAVYGYIEVKASLRSTSDRVKTYADNSIETCILRNKRLRRMRQRKYYRPRDGSPIEAVLFTKKCIPIRSFVFAFETSGKVARNPEQFAKRIFEFSRETTGVHLHGVFVGGSAYYETVPVDTAKAKPADFYHVKYTRENALAVFRYRLLHSLSRFPRHDPHWTPAIDQYYEARPEWMEYPYTQ